MRSASYYMVAALLMVALLVLATSSVDAHFWPADTQVTQLTAKTMGRYLSTHRPVCILMYAEWCGHCKSIVPEWDRFSKAMKDVVRVGAIDANTHQAVAQQFNIQGFPTIKCWAMGNKKGKSPTDYVGPRTAASFQNHALGMIKGNALSAIGKEQFTEAVSAASLKKAFVLFTNKDKVAPIFNVLSASPNYEGKIAFIVVKTSHKKGKELAAQLIGADAKLPSMRLYSMGDAGELEAPVEYTGAVDYTAIAKYLVAVAKGDDASGSSGGGEAVSAPSGGESEEDENSKPKEEEEEAPVQKKAPKRALPVTVTPIDAAAVADFCSGSAMGRKQPFCVVIFPTLDAEGADPEKVRQYFEMESILFFTGDDAVFETLRTHFTNADSPQTTLALKTLVFRTPKPGTTKFAWVNGAESQELQNSIGHIMEGIKRLSRADGPPKL